MGEDQYCPVCFSTLETGDIEEGTCPECGADLSELSASPSSDEDSATTGEEDHWEDLEKAIIATLFFLDD